MDIEQLVIIGVLLVLLAEITYLVAKLPRQVNSKKKMMFVDTSVLIDGRIVAVAASGFIGDTLAIPRSVIGELQFLADHADAEKRARARHGLDVARDLQELSTVETILFQDGSKAEEGVDERLLNLAKKHGGSICTIDYNLNKVAVVEGITVCNVNELAKNLRMAFLPGEKTTIELVQKGQDSHQAVGYLPDGTMVVVEQSSSQIGQSVEVEFIRSLQTAAGKMMFAKKVAAPASEPQKQKQKQAAKKPTGTKPARHQQSPQLPHQQPAQKPQASQTPEVRQQPKPKPQPQPQPKRQNQRRRSSDVESSLMDLVNKQ